MQFIDESCIVFDDEEENKLECIWLTAMLIFFYQRKQTGTYDQGVEERTGHEERTVPYSNCDHEHRDYTMI